MPAPNESQPFTPGTTFARVEALYATFRSARIEPDSPQSRDSFGAVHSWLMELRARDERRSVRRAQILVGAAIAIFTAGLSVFGPWIFHVLTAHAP